MRRGLQEEQNILSGASSFFHCNYFTTSSDYKVDWSGKIIVRNVYYRIHPWRLGYFLHL